MSSTLVATLIAANQSKAAIEPLALKIADQLSRQPPQWLAHQKACDILIQSDISEVLALEEMRAFLDGHAIDLAIQPLANRRKKALIADMDSTMIDQECIDELAAEIGIKEHVAAITAKAMNGLIAFEPALRERVALLKGMPNSMADKVIKSRITLAKGGKTLIATMKANNGYCALVSGGFTLFTSKIAAELGFDEHRANILEVENGLLTGKVREPILGAEAKVSALIAIAEEHKWSVADFIAVGDGANDLPMLMTAGSGIALHAKPSVAAKAKIRIDHNDLTALLYLQGYHERQFVDL